MEINENFLANAGFGLVAAGGQALTMQVASRTDSTRKHVGYADIVLNYEIALQMAALGNSDGLIGISPAISFTAQGQTGTLDAAADAKGLFRNFLQHNTAHISKLNFRAPSATTLPTSMLILTPNIFTGQMDRQVLNITADTTMYQQQANIVTINTVDLYIGRDSIIRFDGAFTENAQQVLNIDVTIDRYISVERALVQNLQLLDTQSGQVMLAAQVLNAEAAKTSPDVITSKAVDEVSKVTMPVTTAAGWYANNVKGFNSRGNR